ncbi:G5 domain-containing protein [Sediminihabitans luteus]|uniref:aggregation-promoting factor C-terminal-like domain-containing protein n=1 Tax=Sediminihabitans luteus TaxID=1138585 RepID=UPI001474FB80|nr:G5 domain-containing protein [Sediminihabitans luteus]
MNTFFRSAPVPGDAHPDRPTLDDPAPVSGGAAVRRRPRWAVPVAIAGAFVTVVTTGAFVYAGSRATVALDVDGVTTTVTTGADDVAGLLEAQGIEVGDRDLVAPDLSAPVEEGEDVVVRTAREVTVQDGDDTRDVWTTELDADRTLAALEAREDTSLALVASRSQADGRVELPVVLDESAPVEVVADGDATVVDDGAVDVDEALADADVAVDDDDRVTVERDEKDAATPVEVVVQRVETSTETSTAPVAHGTTTVKDADRYTDEGSVVTTAGKDGVKTTTSEVTRVDGKVESSTPVSSEVTTAPVDEVVTVGTKARPAATPASNEALGRQMAASRGWGGSQAQCLDSLWTRESGWDHRAANPSSGAYGIPQALPGSKMGAAGGDWQTNPETQIAWGLDYIASVYGTPCGAWGHSQSVGWY